MFSVSGWTARASIWARTVRGASISSFASGGTAPEATPTEPSLRKNIPSATATTSRVPGKVVWPRPLYPHATVDPSLLKAYTLPARAAIPTTPSAAPAGTSVWPSPLYPQATTAPLPFSATV